MANGSTKRVADASLNRMTSVLFHHSIASEETCFIAGMVKEIDATAAENVCFSFLSQPDELLIDQLLF